MALMLRTQFGDLNFDTALPAIRDIIQSKYSQYPAVKDMLFNVESSSRSIEQSTGVTGFKRMVETPEGMMHATDLAYQWNDKTYNPVKYTLGFSYTREMLEDDQYGIIAKLSEALGKSGFDTQETHGAELFSDAFTGATFVGGDGLALCSTVHPLVSGVEQNTLSNAADLSVVSLQQATIDMQDTTDDRGLLLNIMPKWLLLPNELQYVGFELLKSNLLPGTANNNINSLQETKLSPVVWNYLSDPDAWFLVADKGQHDLHWYNRSPFEISDYDKPEIEAKVVKSRMKYSRGFNDWRGVFGSPGA